MKNPIGVPTNCPISKNALRLFPSSFELSRLSSSSSEDPIGGIDALAALTLLQSLNKNKIPIIQIGVVEN